jgi:hypothetical protein
MGAKAMKLMMVPQNGQISIGKNWAGRQIRVEEVNEHEIRISAGVFVPESQKTFFTPEAKEALEEFNVYEQQNPARATDTKALFARLKKKKLVVRGK